MKLYFAGEGFSHLIVKHRLEKLSSFYFKKELLKYWKLSGDRKVFLDSGAFSAFTKDIKININEYINFIKQHNDKIINYNGLDVIGSWQETEEN